jgi:thiol-disulfide isomerase/thioredoxin
MHKVNYLIFALLFPLFLNGKVNFHKGSLNDVQRLAAIEGKPYFIDFYAGYCLPCRLMDETTFMDETLGAYVTANYIPLKLNIDDFDAYEVKVKYEVPALPTVMVFSSNGAMLETRTGAMSATDLLQLLQKHNLPQNRQKATPPKKEVLADETEPLAFAKPTATPPVSKPTAPTKPAPKPVTTPTAPRPAAVPTLIAPPTKPAPKPVTTPTAPRPAAVPTLIAPPTTAQTKPTAAAPRPAAVPKLTPPTKPTTTPVTPPITTAQPEPQKIGGLYEFTSKKHESKGFAIQIGLFAEYGNVLTEVEKIQQLFPTKKVLVHITEFNGKVVYRVAIGTFATYQLAANALPQVRDKGFESFVKDLSTLK